MIYSFYRINSAIIFHHQVLKNTQRMEKISTKNNLVRLLYNDLSLSTENALRNELSGNDVLAYEYEMLRDAKNALPKVLFNPSDSVLDRIMAYSQKTAHQPHF